MQNFHLLKNKKTYKLIVKEILETKMFKIITALKSMIDFRCVTFAKLYYPYKSMTYRIITTPIQSFQVVLS